MSPMLIAPICAPGMPGISNIGMPPPDGRTSISISLSLSSPARSFLRKASLVEALALAPTSASTHALLGGLLGAHLDVLALAFAGQRDADLDQVAHDLLDVAADIADLGELGRLDLDERRAGEPRQPARNFGLADAGRADHQDVLRQHLLAQLVVELQPPPAVAQRDRDRALGVALADDEAVELGDDFAGREVGHALRTIRKCQGRPASRRRGRRSKASLFISPDRSRVGRIGIDHEPRRSVRQQALGEGADERRAVAAVEHVRLADELVEAARAGRLRAERLTFQALEVVALQIGERTAPLPHDELLHVRMTEIAADQLELLGRVMPPLRARAAFRASA